MFVPPSTGRGNRRRQVAPVFQEGGPHVGPGLQGPQGCLGHPVRGVGTIVDDERLQFEQHVVAGGFVFQPLDLLAQANHAVVDGETADGISESTIQRLLLPDVTAEQFRNEFASLTLGSGAAAMVLARAELVPGAPRYKGGVTRAATEWNKLCRGNLDRMVTDTRMLLIEGLKLASKTFAAAKLALGWVVGEMDEFVIHQVSRVHTDAMVKAFGIDPQKVLTIFHEHGNIGPASVPIVLSKLRELGRLKKGHRIALLGIGSGLNCSMAEVVW